MDIDQERVCSRQHVETNSIGTNMIVVQIGAGQPLSNEASPTQQIVADDRLRHITHDFNGVVTHAADHGRHNLRTGAEDVNRVAAFQRIDLCTFNVVELDVEAGAKDAFRRDHKRIVERRPKNDNLVEAAATIDADRRIHRVLDGVTTAATSNLRVTLHGQIDCYEGADHERVVVILTFESQRALVTVNVKDICAVATEGSQ